VSGGTYSASANQTDHAQQHNCPRKSDKGAPDIEARRAFCTELVKQKTTDQRTGDPNHDVQEQPLLAIGPVLAELYIRSEFPPETGWSTMTPLFQSIRQKVSHASVLARDGQTRIEGRMVEIDRMVA
jgi:hypothetical protein